MFAVKGRCAAIRVSELESFSNVIPYKKPIECCPADDADDDRDDVVVKELINNLQRR